MWGLDFLGFVVTNSYVCRLQILAFGVRYLTFWGYKFLRLGLDLLRLGVTISYVSGLDFFRLGITNPYVRELDFLRLGTTNCYVWRLAFLRWSVTNS